ncbi:hypothetical protein J6590_041925 [Homalodisca vitripennis]|nr:hypothetical protein J6590_041925 [Homalodisca vitripennis]
MAWAPASRHRPRHTAARSTRFISLFRPYRKVNTYRIESVNNNLPTYDSGSSSCRKTMRAVRRNVKPRHVANDLYLNHDKGGQNRFPYGLAELPVDSRHATVCRSPAVSGLTFTDWRKNEDCYGAPFTQEMRNGLESCPTLSKTRKRLTDRPPRNANTRARERGTGDVLIRANGNLHSKRKQGCVCTLSYRGVRWVGTARELPCRSFGCHVPTPSLSQGTIHCYVLFGSICIKTGAVSDPVLLPLPLPAATLNLPRNI